jgi:hypothetical protein
MCTVSQPLRLNLRNEAPRLLDITESECAGTTFPQDPTGGSKSRVYELRWPVGKAWMGCSPSPSPPLDSFFYDHDGKVVAEVKGWLDKNRNNFASRTISERLYPCIVNGLVKVDLSHLKALGGGSIDL